MSINPPPRPTDHPDRFLDAQEGIEAATLQVAEAAVAAGWGEQEAIAAIISVVENRALALQDNSEIDDLLRRLNL